MRTASKDKSTLLDAQREALKLLEPHWSSVMKRLRLLFPQATVRGRLRPDIYFSNKGIVARDSAGVRVIFDSAGCLDDAIKIVASAWVGAEIRDYRSGHPRSPYYRAAHFFVDENSFEVEIQLKTHRQHLIAEWAHDKLLSPSTGRHRKKFDLPVIVDFLVALSSYYDDLDHQIRSEKPEIPVILKTHALSLGYYQETN